MPFGKTKMVLPFPRWNSRPAMNDYFTTTLRCPFLPIPAYCDESCAYFHDRLQQPGGPMSPLVLSPTVTSVTSATAPSQSITSSSAQESIVNMSVPPSLGRYKRRESKMFLFDQNTRIPFAKSLVSTGRRPLTLTREMISAISHSGARIWGGGSTKPWGLQIKMFTAPDFLTYKQASGFWSNVKIVHCKAFYLVPVVITILDLLLFCWPPFFLWNSVSHILNIFLWPSIAVSTANSVHLSPLVVAVRLSSF